MPLAPKYLAQIKQELNIEIKRSENLGTALRRACGFAPSQTSWQERLELIAEIAAELADTNPEELIKSNKESKNALKYAIDCLFADAKAASSFEEIANLQYHLHIIITLCSYYPADGLDLDDYLSQFVSEEYRAEDDFYFQGLTRGFSSLPSADVTARAVKFILFTMRTGMSIFELSMPRNLPPMQPIVLASAHIDTGIQQFFDEYLNSLTDKGYKLVCQELPRDFTPQQYLAIGKTISTVKGVPLVADVTQQLQNEISQSVIRAAIRCQAEVVFIDPTPASPPQEQAFIAYLNDAVEIIGLVNDMREQAMVRQTILSAIEHATNPILLIGTNHHAAVKALFKEMGINARCLLVTSGTEETKDLYPKKIKGDIKIIDFSLQPSRSEVLSALGIAQGLTLRG